MIIPILTIKAKIILRVILRVIRVIIILMLRVRVMTKDPLKNDV
jgi:hypothetical protein